jgi:hypothetical protein
VTNWIGVIEVGKALVKSGPLHERRDQALLVIIEHSLPAGLADDDASANLLCEVENNCGSSVRRDIHTAPNGLSNGATNLKRFVFTPHA